MASLQHGIAVPNFGTDPAALIDLGVAAEHAGFDGYFLWDHIVFSDSGDGPPILDPWAVLAVVAARTSRIRLGTVVTPVPRRRPWQLAQDDDDAGPAERRPVRARRRHRLARLRGLRHLR